MKANKDNEAKVGPSDVRRYLDYDPETGDFLWKERVGGFLGWNRRWAGKRAGYVDRRGYVNIDIHQTTYQGQRLAWLYVYGEWPRHEIDHIDGNTTNNIIANLRAVTHTENLQNTTARRHNKLGLKNISVRKGGYGVSFFERGKPLYREQFSSLETAIFVRELLAPNIYGHFDRKAQ